MSGWLEDDLQERRRNGLYRVRRLLQSPQGVRIRLDGRELLNFSSNDYLNLATDPRLAKAASRAARRYGAGSGASALVSGCLPPLRSLERALARWEGTEAALVFSSGFAANLALVSSLAGPKDVIFSDALNHASLIDGSRLSRARIQVYQHACANHLEELLQREGAQARRRIIVTDTVFSMEGDLAPLAEILNLAEKYDCLLVIDEAHATGVLGSQGKGVSELLPPQSFLNPDRVFKVGTLSKGLGCQGGFVCGSKRFIAWLMNSARPYIFSTALAPPVAAAAKLAVSIVADEPQRRGHLLELAEKLRRGLEAAGYPPTKSQCSIVPLVVGSAQAAMALSRRLQERGLLVPAIRPPSVPDGTARLRMSLTAGHTENDIQCLLTALREEWPANA